MEVALFITCLTDNFFPRVGEAVVRVLRHFGCRVVFPAEQTCCGQPAYTAGELARVDDLARRMIRIFEPYECVVTPSASCAAMVLHHYTEVLAQDPLARRAAESLAARTHEFGVFLSQTLGIDVAALLKLSEPATYHWPCHARHVYSPEELRTLLAGGDTSSTTKPSPATVQSEIRPCAHDDMCCGFGGSFAVDFAETSAAMMRDRLAELSATGARLVICNEGGCSLQLSGGAHRMGLPLRFRHVAELLAESLGLMAPETQERNP